jgi:hypothetical protein
MTTKPKVSPIRIHETYNFQTKRQRKQFRKSLVRGYISNKLVDKSIARESRAQFYRNLRVIKQRRITIAKEFSLLSDVLHELEADLNQFQRRLAQSDLDHYLAESSLVLTRKAYAAVSAAAAELKGFSHRKVWYTEDLVA